MTDGSDLEWLGLERVGPGHWSFVLTPGLSRLDNRLYGGTGLAVSVAAMEAETGRRALWSTAQYVASCATGDRLDSHVEVIAAGRRSSQVRITGTQADRLVWIALGACGEEHPSTLDHQFGTPPVVAPPEECPPWAPRWLPNLQTRGERPGWLGITDVRVAGDGRAMWMRLEDQHLTRAALAFLADTIPSMVLHAAGRLGGGTSLDNTIRFGPEPDGQWLLVDVDPHLISAGYVHGAARLWSEPGRLLGVASQTATAIVLD